LQATPQKVNEAKRVLTQMEVLVQAMHQHEASTPVHEEWLTRLRAAWSRHSTTEAAALLVGGPLNRPMDADLTEAQIRRQTLAGALLEAAIYEEVQLVTHEQEFGKTGHDQTEGALAQDDPKQAAPAGLPAPDKVQAALVDWLALGAWRRHEQSPLTEIGRMVERSSETAEDAVATRLGLLVPFWSSLALWRVNFARQAS